jgi:hypothetical protein
MEFGIDNFQIHKILIAHSGSKDITYEQNRRIRATNRTPEILR